MLISLYFFLSLFLTLKMLCVLLLYLITYVYHTTLFILLYTFQYLVKSFELCADFVRKKK